jgi:hypothetical protein
VEEIKLWALENDGVNKLNAIPIGSLTQMEAESQLEELLVRSPDILMPNLRLVGRQNPTVSGFLDLLGIDEDGNLVVFELKRGTLTREAVAQSIDYASWLADMTKKTLAQHISERSGTGGVEKIADFDGWYQETYPNNPSGYVGQPRIVLVGLGADERTERMTSYLAQSNLNISLITFYCFKRDNNVLLAKHVNVKAPETEVTGQVKYTKTTNLEALMELAAKCGSAPLLESTASFLRDTLPAYEWPSKSGFSYSLMQRTEQGAPTYRVYVSIYLNDHKPGQLQMVFWKRAVEAAPQAFADLKTQTGAKFLEKNDNLELWIKSPSDWENLRPALQPVLASIVEGWKTKSKEQIIQ